MGKGVDVRTNETKSEWFPTWGRATSTFHILERMEALERRQRNVLIKINYKIGTIKKSISGII